MKPKPSGRSGQGSEAKDASLSLSGPHGLDLVVQMAHDLRSPMSSILILAECLQSGQSGPVNETQRRQLSLIHSAALCLSATASDVIELARGGETLTDQRAAPFSISDVLDAVRDMVLPMAVERGLELRVKRSAADPREGHERPIARILLNLSTNALKYTDHGFVEISARELEGHPSLVEFAVSDSGRGIESAEMRSLFEPFRERPSQRGNQFSSSGLGLAICQKLVHAMDSTLRVETRPKRGSRFSFVVELPVSKSYTPPSRRP